MTAAATLGAGGGGPGGKRGTKQTEEGTKRNKEQREEGTKGNKERNKGNKQQGCRDTNAKRRQPREDVTAAKCSYIQKGHGFRSKARHSIHGSKGAREKKSGMKRVERMKWDAI